MNPEEKGFRRNFQKFRTSAKKVPCDTKLPLYWQLIEECMEKDDKNASYIIAQSERFLDGKIKSLETKYGIT